MTCKSKRVKSVKVMDDKRRIAKEKLSQLKEVEVAISRAKASGKRKKLADLTKTKLRLIREIKHYAERLKSKR